MKSILLGVSTACFYPELTEVSLEELGKMQVKNVEIFLNSYTESSVKFVREKLFPVIKFYDINITTLHPFSSMLETSFIFGNYERRTKEGMELYKRQFEAAAELSAKTLVLHGPAKQMNLSIDTFLERYIALEELGKGFGVTLALENVVRCKSGELEFIKELKSIKPDIQFVLDLKQARREGIEPIKFLDAMGKNIAHIHISDGGKDGDCMPIGAGSENFEEIFKKLDNFGFCGSISLELYRTGYTHYNELLLSLDKLKSASLGLIS